MGNKKKAIQERLQHLHARDGSLTPSAVVEDARDPESPLHSEFVWDDKKAAEKQRLDAARRLIRSIKVFVSVEEHVLESPCYVHDPRELGQRYVEVQSVRGDVEHARELVKQELKRVVAALQRANRVAAALDLSHEMTGLITAATNLSDRLEDRPSE